MYLYLTEFQSQNPFRFNCESYYFIFVISNVINTQVWWDWNSGKQRNLSIFLDLPRYEEINHTHRASTRVTCHFIRQSYHQISDLYYLHCPTLCYSCAKSWRWSGNELYETKVLQIELSDHKVYRFITIIIDVVKMIVVSLTVLLLIKNEKIRGLSTIFKKAPET